MTYRTFIAALTRSSTICLHSEVLESLWISVKLFQTAHKSTRHLAFHFGQFNFTLLALVTSKLFRKIRVEEQLRY